MSQLAARMTRTIVYPFAWMAGMLLSMLVIIAMSIVMPVLSKLARMSKARVDKRGGTDRQH